MKVTDRILEALTKQDIIDLMTKFKVEHEFTSNGDLRFKSHCHGSESFKLYYYERNSDGEIDKHFLCYSNCGGMSVFNTFMQINNWTFNECKEYLASYKNISTLVKKERGFNNSKNKTSDWDFINKYQEIYEIENQIEEKILLPEIDRRVLNVFEAVYPSSWENEGISIQAMKKYGIRFYMTQFKAILPHYDYLGRLIGIRGRAFLDQDIESGKKYMPVYIEGEGYRHSLKHNLYGLYQNLETIKRIKKVIIFEGEKSVLLCESFYPDMNFSVAICGRNLSNYQRDLLIHTIGVEEVIIAIDKEYQDELITEEDIKEYEQYVKKVKNIADKFVNYVNVSIVYCDDKRLSYQDSPCDKGKETLEQLMKEKERYYGEERY